MVWLVGHRKREEYSTKLFSEVELSQMSAFSSILGWLAVIVFIYFNIVYVCF